MFLYRTILKKAWQITKTNKHLWFFGLFAAPILNGNIHVDNTGLYISGIYNGGVYGVLWQNFILEPIRAGEFFWAWCQNTPLSSGIQLSLEKLGFLNGAGQPSVVIAVLFLLASAFLAWLMIVSISSLVNAIVTSTKSSTTTIRDGLAVGQQSFLGVTFLLALGIVASSFLYTLFELLFGLSLTSNSPILISILFVGLIFILLAFIMAYFTLWYAGGFIIVKGLKPLPALREGFQLFMNSRLVQIEFSALLFLVTLVAGVIGTLLIIQFIGNPIYNIIYEAEKSNILPYPEYWYQGLRFSQLVLKMGFWGVVAVFQVSAWTLLFLELLKKNPVESKTSRIATTLQSLVTKPTPTNDTLE